MKDILISVPNNSEEFGYQTGVSNAMVYVPSKWRLNSPTIDIFYGFENLFKDLKKGGFPIEKITSSYRNPVHNLAVGGVMNSNHTKGFAIDATVKDYKYGDLEQQKNIKTIYLECLNSLNAENEATNTGYKFYKEIIFYPTFIHFGFDVVKNDIPSKPKTTGIQDESKGSKILNGSVIAALALILFIIMKRGK